MSASQKIQPVTIEAIKEALAPSFEAINTRLGDMDKRFDGMDKRFDRADQRFDGMDKRFDHADQRFDGMDERFDHADEKHLSLTEGVADLFETFTLKLERRFKAFKGEIVHEMKFLLDNDKRIHVGVESADMAASAAVGVKGLDARVSVLERDLKVVKEVLKS
jgi:hypothetical protein